MEKKIINEILNFGIVEFFKKESNKIFVNELDSHGRNLLFYVSNVEEVKMLDKLGINFSVKDFDNNTPIFYQDDLELVKLFVEKGVNFNEKNKRGKTPILTTHNIDVLKFLLTKDAAIDFKELLVKINFAEKDFLYEIYKKINVNALNSDEKFKILTASIENIESLQALKKVGFTEFNLLNNNKENILFSYVSNRNANITHLKNLLKFGIDINVVNDRKENLLFEVSNKKMFNYLVKMGLDFTKNNSSNETILHKNCSIEVVKEAVSRGLSVGAINSSLNPPFQTNYNKEASIFLLKQLIITRKNSFCSQINFSTLFSDLDLFKCVANYCHKSQTYPYFSKEKLKEVFESYSTNIKKDFFKYVKKIKMNASDDSTSILLAIKNKEDFILGLSYFKEDINKNFIDGNSLLIKKMKKDYYCFKLDLLEYMVNKVKDINFTDDKGNSAIFYVYSEEQLNVFLKNKKVNLDIVNNNGKTLIEHIESGDGLVSMLDEKEKIIDILKSYKNKKNFSNMFLGRSSDFTSNKKMKI